MKLQISRQELLRLLDLGGEEEIISILNLPQDDWGTLKEFTITAEQAEKLKDFCKELGIEPPELIPQPR